MPREFPVIPASPHAAWLLAALLSIPAAMIVIGGGLGATSADQAIGAANDVVGLVVIAAIAVLVFWGLGRRRVQLDGQQLRIKAAMFSHRVDIGTLDLQRARIVNLDERIELRPALKTFGMGMTLPSYHAGWFALRNGDRAFCLVTTRRRALWLPKRTGGSLLLSLESPESLLDALRAAAPGPAGQRG